MVQVTESNGGPGRSRTADQRFRKPLLYPTELRGRCNLTRLSHAGLPKQALGVPDLVSGIANLFGGKTHTNASRGQKNSQCRNRHWLNAPAN